MNKHNSTKKPEVKTELFSSSLNRSEQEDTSQNGQCPAPGVHFMPFLRWWYLSPLDKSRKTLTTRAGNSYSVQLLPYGLVFCAFAVLCDSVSSSPAARFITIAIYIDLYVFVFLFFFSFPSEIVFFFFSFCFNILTT